MSEKIIGYIENGIVVDHIPQGEVWKLARILGFDSKGEGRVSLGDGYASQKIDKKGILKVEGASLSEYQLNLIALIAENASVSIVENGVVVDKKKIEIPKLMKIVYCNNQNCISNDAHEKLDPKVNYKGDGIFLCDYCKRIFGKKDLKFVGID
ncbi:MAG: aspartate carbamoyltransferase regulatory subunit [Nanoarchaeota archaeon]|nr:aspartate carbamoyltransferase regulatory subunit [Nanoarchaeota archaeon]